MGRKKTISDERLLEVARATFRERGYAVAGREIAKAAGISEAVLYQRFESKDALFFAAMAPAPPDLLRIFGPRGREGDPRAWIREVLERMAATFEELVPLAIQVIQVLTHQRPRTSPGREKEHGGISRRLEEELASRLRALQARGAVAEGPPLTMARLLVSIAHDRALNRAILAHRSSRAGESLAACLDVVWRGLAPGRALPRAPSPRSASRAPGLPGTASRRA